jgi:small redox-active disulfide protein 2
MRIKVFGPGCANCKRLEQHTMQALAELQQTAEVRKVEAISEIAEAGVMRTPALEVNDKILFQGRVPEVRELVSMLATVLAESS